MKIILKEDALQLGKESAKIISGYINEAIEEKGSARIILGTGASQINMLEALIKSDVDWSKVEMFHLDEYIGISKDHPASFVKYMKERFVDKVNLKAVYYVDPTNGVDEIIDKLTEKIREEVIDVACIGIGENGHIAFNDPPADFDTKEAFKVVELDEGCRNQQLREGWFPTFEDVPTHAITMTVFQILEAKHIVCGVPYKVKAEAVKNTLENDVTNLVPATILKTHPSTVLLLDKESASLVDIERYKD